MNNSYIFVIIFLLSSISFFSIAPFVPTRKKDLKRISDLVALKESENLLEIWCWTAKVCLFIAKHYPNNKIVWVELSPLFYVISKVKVFFSWIKNLEIIFWDAMKLDFSKYDVFYVFWLPETITKLLFPKLDKEIKNNSRFFSYCFQMQNDKFIEIKHKEKEKINSIYEYRKT